MCRLLESTAASKETKRYLSTLLPLVENPRHEAVGEGLYACTDILHDLVRFSGEFQFLITTEDDGHGFLLSDCAFPAPIDPDLIRRGETCLCFG